MDPVHILDPNGTPDGTTLQSGVPLAEDVEGRNARITESKQVHYHPDYPFRVNSLAGDLVLLSKDGVHFHVHSIILKFASSFFREMLEIPRTCIESADDPVPLEETAAIIAVLLNVIYPCSILREEANKMGLDLFAEELITAADKYDMPAISTVVKKALFASTVNVPSLHAKWSAIRLFDLAHKHRWVEEERIASGWTLHYCLTSPEAISEMRRVTVHTTLHLQELQRKRIQMYKASLNAMAYDCLPSVGKKKVNKTLSCRKCNCQSLFQTSDAWKLFEYEISEELITYPLGWRLLKDEIWDGRGYAQIFEILHEDPCYHAGNLILPSKSAFILQAQDALKTLPTFL